MIPYIITGVAIAVVSGFSISNYIDNMSNVQESKEIRENAKQLDYLAKSSKLSKIKNLNHNINSELDVIKHSKLSNLVLKNQTHTYSNGTKELIPIDKDDLILLDQFQKYIDEYYKTNSILNDPDCTDLASLGFSLSECTKIWDMNFNFISMDNNSIHTENLMTNMNSEMKKRFQSAMKNVTYDKHLDMTNKVGTSYLNNKNIYKNIKLAESKKSNDIYNKINFILENKNSKANDLIHAVNLLSIYSKIDSKKMLSLVDKIKVKTDKIKITEPYFGTANNMMALDEFVSLKLIEAITFSLDDINTKNGKLLETDKQALNTLGNIIKENQISQTSITKKINNVKDRLTKDVMMTVSKDNQTNNDLSSIQKILDEKNSIIDLVTLHTSGSTVTGNDTIPVVKETEHITYDNVNTSGNIVGDDFEYTPTYETSSELTDLGVDSDVILNRNTIPRQGF